MHDIVWLMTVLKLSDSEDMAVKKMAKQGNSGVVHKAAERVLELLVRDADRFDPESNASNIRHLLLLDKFKIYGRDIYTLYDRQCSGDISLLILLLRITELGIYSSSGLQSLAAKPSGVCAFNPSIWRKHIDAVKKHRPYYKSSYAVLGSKNYWAYLYFRALWLNDDYKAFCYAKRESDFKKQNSLRKKYPRLGKIYLFWGDIFGNPEHRSELAGFDQWAKINVYKLEHIFFDRIQLVNGGDTVTADERTIYFTIPQSASKKFIAKVLNEKMTHLFEGIPEIDLISELGIGAADREEYKSLYPTERRLDVYYWREVHKVPNRELALRLYCSDSGAWEKFGISIEKTLIESGLDFKKVQDVDLSTQTDTLKDILKEGKKLINSVLLNEFPRIS